ncbi:hypothetical protein PR048_025352 [Dryococelus australis]|uniref:Uncharacterized protein n=1 Tax=Dryococelus australis TaxID=614101 RepID=A0ABQ9GR58_9NEOP|nr:hypothetical protein PR048_025352 [Dryococelus australis]
MSVQVVYKIVTDLRLRLFPVESLVYRIEDMVEKIHAAVTTVDEEILNNVKAISSVTSHQGEPGSISGRVTGFSQVGIVPDNVIGRRVFSGISIFSCPFIPAPLHIHFNITLIGSQDLAVKSRPNLFTHSFSLAPQLRCRITSVKIHRVEVRLLQAWQDVNTAEPRKFCRAQTAFPYCAYWSLSCVFIGCCPTPGSCGIRKVFPCKSAIGSEACRAGLINCDPIAKADLSATGKARHAQILGKGVSHQRVRMTQAATGVLEARYENTTFRFSGDSADLLWRSLLVRHRSGVRKALGSNPRGLSEVRQKLQFQKTLRELSLTFLPDDVNVPFSAKRLLIILSHFVYTVVFTGALQTRLRLCRFWRPTTFSQRWTGEKKPAHEITRNSACCSGRSVNAREHGKAISPNNTKERYLKRVLQIETTSWDYLLPSASKTLQGLVSKEVEKIAACRTHLVLSSGSE